MGFQSNNPKGAALTGNIANISYDKITHIQGRTGFTFVVSFRDKTPSWTLAADTEVSIHIGFLQDAGEG